MESRSTECDCSIKLKEQQEEMKACYAQLDKKDKNLQSMGQLLEESESVKSQVDKKCQELQAILCQLQASYDELKAEKEGLEKSSNWNIEIMRERLTVHENHITSLIKKVKEKERDIDNATKKVRDKRRDVDILRQTLTDKDKYIEKLRQDLANEENLMKSIAELCDSTNIC